MWFRIHVKAGGGSINVWKTVAIEAAKVALLKETSGRGKNRWVLLHSVELCGFYFYCC